MFFVCPRLFVFGFLYTSCILFFLIQLLLPIIKKKIKKITKFHQIIPLWVDQISLSAEHMIP